jgi:hypothetical protein
LLFWYYIQKTAQNLIPCYPFESDSEDEGDDIGKREGEGDGVKWQKGVKGLKGLKGLKGVKGVKGVKGQKGVKGMIGLEGQKRLRALKGRKHV